MTSTRGAPHAAYDPTVPADGRRNIPTGVPPPACLPRPPEGHQTGVVAPRAAASAQREDTSSVCRALASLHEGLPRLPLDRARADTDTRRKPRRVKTIDIGDLYIPFPLLRKEGIDIVSGRISEALILAIRNLSPTLSTNWAGAFAPRPTSEPFNNVFGHFLVPSIWPPWSAAALGGFKDGIYEAATWVGLDGISGTSDVMQSGVDCTATVSSGAVSTDYYAWSSSFRHRPNASTTSRSHRATT